MLSWIGSLRSGTTKPDFHLGSPARPITYTQPHRRATAAGFLTCNLYHNNGGGTFGGISFNSATAPGYIAVIGPDATSHPW